MVLIVQLLYLLPLAVLGAQGAQFAGEVYAISLGIVWIGVWLWRRPSHRQAFRALAVVVWLLSVTSLVWGAELVGGD